MKGCIVDLWHAVGLPASDVRLQVHGASSKQAYRALTSSWCICAGGIHVHRCLHLHRAYSCTAAGRVHRCQSPHSSCSDCDACYAHTWLTRHMRCKHCESCRVRIWSCLHRPCTGLHADRVSTQCVFASGTSLELSSSPPGPILWRANNSRSAQPNMNKRFTNN